MTFYDQLIKASMVIQQRAPHFAPQVALILDADFGSLADELIEVTRIPYKEIPGFPTYTNGKHTGMLIFGKLSNVPVMCLNGHVPIYEGTDPDKLKMPIRLAKHLGCHTLITTNTSGSLRPEIPPGELFIITDHINLFHYNPLIGPNDNECGPRLYSMENAYDKTLREHLVQTALTLNIPLHEGIYSAILGPAFETPAEANVLKTLGVDIMGMSIISDVFIARHCDLKVVALSVVNHWAADCAPQEESAQHNGQTFPQAADKLKRLIKTFLKKSADQTFEETVKSALVQDDVKKVASRILPLIDLTSLNLDDTEERLSRLCLQANTEKGQVSTLCVLPRFVKHIKNQLQKTMIKTGTLVNFPSGKDPLEKVLTDIHYALEAGAQEIDVIWPYSVYLEGDEITPVQFVRECKKACGQSILLKVILETNKYPDVQTIYQASCLAIDAGADFIVTSTGKVEAHATPDAAAAILLAIRECKKPIGFKAAGGIRTLEQAVQYLEIAEYIMGSDWISQTHFRFGTQTLLNDILEHIG